MFEEIPKGVENALKTIQDSNLEDFAKKRKNIIENIKKIGEEVSNLQNNYQQGVFVDKYRVEFLQMELSSLREELSHLDNAIKNELNLGLEKE